MQSKMNCPMFQILLSRLKMKIRLSLKMKYQTYLQLWNQQTKTFQAFQNEQTNLLYWQMKRKMPITPTLKN